MQDRFLYDLTPVEEEDQRWWEKAQLEKEVKQWKKDNFVIKAVHLFRGKNNKIKLREANSFSDHARLYKAWISEQQKKGRVFKYRSHSPLPWDIHPKINLGITNVESIIPLYKK
jgi:hypothetical protein